MHLDSFCPWGIFHFHLEYYLVEQGEALVSQRLMVIILEQDISLIILHH